ncbi:Rossmann-like and DUF2520 domain-containing protein, partial [Streptosporangium algeriense]
GPRVVAASGVSDSSRERAVERLGVTPTRPEDVVAKSDLILMTVPDDVLPDLVSGLAGTGAAFQGKLVAHTSGAYGLAVLNPAIRAGSLPLALHPVMTFTGREDDLRRLTGISYGVTAPDMLRPVAEALVIEMEGEPVWIADDDRPLYHAALAGAANHMVTLIAESSELLERVGVEQPGRMLGPLLGAALENVLRLGISGLTGPVVR